MDMKRELRTLRRVGSACCALMVPILIAGPAFAEDEEQVKVVKKVIVRCDGDECEESGDHIVLDVESLHDQHGFAWISGDGPGHMTFRTHGGGGYLGIELAELTPELRRHFGVDESAGVMVSKVLDDSPAARAGLKVGDIISAVEGEAVATSHGLASAIRKKEEGQSVLLEIWRDGSVSNLTAAVEERKPMEHGMDWSFVVDCKDEAGDCSFARRRMLHHKLSGGHGDACAGGTPCEVKIQCESEDRSDCECTVNGEATDCATLPGFDD